jgi:hypothetical protein
MNWAWWDGRISEEEFAHEHGDAHEEWRRSREGKEGETPPEPPES